MYDAMVTRVSHKQAAIRSSSDIPGSTEGKLATNSDCQFGFQVDQSAGIRVDLWLFRFGADAEFPDFRSHIFANKHACIVCRRPGCQSQ